jgi:hypothetical protein
LFCIYCQDTFVVTAYNRHVKRRHANMPYVRGEFWRPEFDDKNNPMYNPIKVAVGETRPVAGTSSSGRPVAGTSGVKPVKSGASLPGTSGVKPGKKVHI